MTLLPALPAAETSTHVDTDGDSVPLSSEAARHLTDAIRLTVEALHVLMHRAYVGKAHHALGYVRWADYIATEFKGMSRARSYQLLTQHAVISTLTEAAGADVSALVSEKVARDIKPSLELVTAEVAERTANFSDRDQVLTVVAEVLNTARRPDADRLNRMPSMAQLRASQARGGASDLWYTPRIGVAPLLGILPPPPLRVWAHADVRGRSHIVDVLEESGYEVLCSDISTGQDFFAFTRVDVEAMGAQVAVTNPPYSVRKRWISHLVHLGLPFALLLPETGVGAIEPLRGVGHEVGFVLLNQRIAYSQRWGAKPLGNPPFSSLWVSKGCYRRVNSWSSRRSLRPSSRALLRGPA